MASTAFSSTFTPMATEKTINTYPHVQLFDADCTPSDIAGIPDRIDDVLYNDMAGSLNNHLQYGPPLINMGCRIHDGFQATNHPAISFPVASGGYLTPVLGRRLTIDPQSISAASPSLWQAFWWPDGYTKFWYRIEVIFPDLGASTMRCRGRIGVMDDETTRTEKGTIFDFWSPKKKVVVGGFTSVAVDIPQATYYEELCATNEIWPSTSGTPSISIETLTTAGKAIMAYVELDYFEYTGNTPGFGPTPTATSQALQTPVSGMVTKSHGVISFQFGIIKDGASAGQ